MSEDRRTVDALARALGAHIYYDAQDVAGYDGPRANTQSRVVHALPIDNGSPEQRASSFWTILHELGHIANKHRGRDPFDRAFGIGGESESEQEAEAWKWGIEHAGRPLDEIGTSNAKFALSSYLYSNGVDTTVIGPNLRWAIETLGPDTVGRDRVEALFGQTMALNQPLANQAWTDAVRKADIKSAA